MENESLIYALGAAKDTSETVQWLVGSSGSAIAICFTRLTSRDLFHVAGYIVKDGFVGLYIINSDK